jgi:hypothetical protein
MNEDVTVYARLAIYGKRYGITLTDYGEITIGDMTTDIGKSIHRKFSVDEIGPILIEYWQKKQEIEEFNKGLIEEKEKIRKAFVL